MTQTIYALIDVNASEIFYVGRTSRTLKERLSSHMADHLGASPKQKRIARILQDWQGDVAITALEGGIKTEKQAFVREVFWMETFLSAGNDLTNASIDFDGNYFLRDLYDDEDTDQSVKPQVEIPEGYLKEIGIHADLYDILCEQDYFRIELVPNPQFRHETPNSTAKIDAIQSIREDNIINSRLINHGTPVTLQEMTLWEFFMGAGASLDDLQDYFQRSKLTIHTYSVIIR